MIRRTPWPGALRLAALIAAAALVPLAPAQAQDQPAGPPAERAPAEAAPTEAQAEPAPSLLAGWDPRSITDPIAATDLIGAAVTDARGNALGAVEDVALDQNDLSVLAIVLPEGRSLDWAEAAIARTDAGVTVTAQGRPGRLDLKRFEDTDAIAPGRQADAVRVSELLDKDMLLNDAVRYGDVVDLIFDSAGTLVAAEAQYNGPTVTRYALPVPPEIGLDPDADHILLPFDFKEVAAMAPVDAG